MTIDGERWWIAAIGAALFATATSGPDDAIKAGARTESARERLALEVPPLRKNTEIRWTSDWQAARIESAQRNVPIVAVLADDQSVGFRTVERTVYSVPEFAAFSHEVVLLAAFDGNKHASSKRIVGGTEVDWCTLFDCRCEDHRASYVTIRDQFAQREYWQPLHVFVSAEGVELTRAEGHEIAFERLREELKRANQDRTGSWWSYRDYRELLERLRALLDQRSSRGGAAVHGELGKLVAGQKKAQADPKLAQPLRTAAVVADVEALREALIEEALGQVEDAADAARIDGAVVAARRTLLSIARDWKGFAPEKAAQSELAKLPAAAGEKRKGG